MNPLCDNLVSGRISFRAVMRFICRTLPFDLFSNVYAPLSEKDFSRMTGVTADRFLDELRMVLEFHGFRTELSDSEYARILSFSCKDYNGIILGLAESLLAGDSIPLDQSLDILIINAVTGVLPDSALDTDTVSGLWIYMDHLLAWSRGIGYDDLRLLKYRNTHERFIRTTASFFEKGLSETALIYHELTLPSNVRTHDNIEVFGALYALELMVLHQLDLKGPLVIHDFGTCLAHFALLIASGKLPFPPSGKSAPVIFASDRVPDSNRYAEKVRGGDYAPIHSRSLDLLSDEDCRDTFSDISVLNDVLEHFSDEDSVRNGLVNVWAMTKGILLLHVPFEALPDKTMGHNISFDPPKLKTLADKLDHAENITDTFLPLSGVRLSDLGFLIIRRTGS